MDQSAEKRYFRRPIQQIHEPNAGVKQISCLLYCGDNKGAKKTAASLIRDVGFNPVDAGPLFTARYVERFSLVVAQVAYDSSDNPALAYRFEHFPNRSR